MENENLKKMQETFTSQVEKQKQLWEEEQNKAKALFDHLRQESIDNFEQARHNIQRHIEEVNSFGKNLQSHLQNQPFDFQSFSKVFSDYHSKQLELLSQATHKQAQKLSELQNKLVSFYEDKQTVVKNEIEKTIDNTVESTKEVVEKIIRPKTVKNKSNNVEKHPVKSTKNKSTAKTSAKTTTRNSKSINNNIPKE